MFSVIFPGQGSQIVGMGKEFFDKYDTVKKLFKEADEALNFDISKLRKDLVFRKEFPGDHINHWDYKRLKSIGDRCGFNYIIESKYKGLDTIYEVIIKK